MSLRQFSEHLEFMAEHFAVVSVSQLVDGDVSPERFSVAVTFDDGYRNNLDLALPLLERHQVPATCFVTGSPLAGFSMLWTDWQDLAVHTGVSQVQFGGVGYRLRGRQFVAEDGRWLRDRVAAADPVVEAAELEQFRRPLAEFESLGPYWRLLDSEGLRRLARSSLVDIGAHSVSHSDLTQVPAESLDWELASVQSLGDATGRTIDMFAFPFGRFDRRVVEAAARAGCRYLFADVLSESGGRDGDSVLISGDRSAQVHPRLTVNPHMACRNQMVSLLSGRY